MKSAEATMAYLAAVGAVVYVLTMGATKYHRDGYVGKLNRLLSKIPWVAAVVVCTVVCCSRVRGRAAAQALEESLFERRHPLMQWAYVILTWGAIIIYFYKVFPLLSKSGLVYHQVLAPLMVLVSQYCFVKACYSDPGEVKDDSHLNDYPYDHSLYFPGRECVTCKLIKPARSKHCKLCGRCVRKFDHHCGWLNNDVGEENYHWFLSFLAAHIVKCGYGTWTCWHLLLYVIDKAKIWKVSFVDAQGARHPATYTTVTQYMIQEFTCVCGELLFMASVTVMMIAFLAYHLYLASANMTTNETFKISDINDTNTWFEGFKKARDELLLKYPEECVTALPEAPPPRPKATRSEWIYNKGWYRNLLEIFTGPKPKARKPAAAKPKPSQKSKASSKKRN